MLKFTIYLYDSSYYICRNENYLDDTKELEIDLCEIDLNTKKLLGNYLLLKIKNYCSFFSEVCIPIGFAEVTEFANIQYVKNIEEIKDKIKGVLNESGNDGNSNAG